MTTPAKKVENMVKELKELQDELSNRGPHYNGVIQDITQALTALDRIRKSLRG